MIYSNHDNLVMGLCEQIHDKLPHGDFLHDIDRLHVWKPNSFMKMAVEIVERINVAESGLNHLFYPVR